MLLLIKPIAQDVKVSSLFDAKTLLYSIFSGGYFSGDWREESRVPVVGPGRAKTDGHPLLKPGAGRSSGRGAALGSAPGNGCGGEGGVGRTFSGSGLFSRSSFSSTASRTSRSNNAAAIRSSVSRLFSKMLRAPS